MISSEGLRSAGWSDGPAAWPKTRALAAAAEVQATAPRLLSLSSRGRCLVIGAGQAALDAAAALAGRLTPIVLLTEVADASPLGVSIPVATGRLTAARGHFTAFEVVVRDLAWAGEGSRAELVFETAADGAVACDLVLDLSGGPSLFTGCEERDGYLRANPRDGLGLGRALLEAADLVGEIEKPVYVELKASLCAHARNRITGCSNCLDTCPAGAITPDGNVVAIDVGICEGCGLCAAQCPTGAISYHLPSSRDLVSQARAMLDAFSEAGGERPVLLLYEAGSGEPLLEASARFGGGLAANVLPLALNSVAEGGHDVLLALLLAGAAKIAVLVPRRHRRHLAALERQAGLANAILGALGYGGRVTLLEIDDPLQLEAALAEMATAQPMPVSAFGLVGSKREIARSALAALHEHAPTPRDIIELPAGSPYGQVRLSQDRCTLCLACVSACPTGALRDTPDQPALRFAEAACVQCGLCVSTCPEDALALEARLDLVTPSADIRVLKAEAPFCCARCGKPFGTETSIARVKRQLAGNRHFTDAARLAMLDLCGDCRVVALMNGAREPMAGPPRPRVVSSEDYLERPAERDA